MLKRLFERRAQSGGNFKVSQQPPGWITKIGGWDTATGMDVSPDTALTSTTVYACVRVLAESVAGLPLVTYRRNSDGSKDRALKHYLYPILHDAPNLEMTSFEMLETMMGHLALWGNAYAEVVYDRSGRVLELWPLRPDRMRVEREGNDLYYYYRVSGNEGESRLPAYRILHIRGLSSNGIMGLSPIQQAREAIGLSMAAQEFGSRFFSNGARPGVVLEHPGRLTPDAHTLLSKTWQSEHQGLDQSHRVAILEEGMKIHEIGIPPEDAQFLETRKFQVADIARIYRIPPHMIGDLDRATFSNIEQQSIEFVVHTLRPWLVRWERRINNQLVAVNDRGKIYTEFLVDGLLRGDTMSRYQAYAIGRQNGWLSANDIRQFENMNPIEDGDEYLIPLNMVPAGQEPAPQPAPVQEESPDETDSAAREEGARAPLYRYQTAAGGAEAIPEQRAKSAAGKRLRLARSQRGVFEDGIKRLNKREAQDINAAAKKFLGRRDWGQFQMWLDKYYQDHMETIYRVMDPIYLAYSLLILGATRDELEIEGEDLDEPTRRWIRTYVAAYASRHGIDHEAQVTEIVRKAQTVEEVDLDAALDGLFDKWQDSEAVLEAQTETNRAGNGLARELYILAGVSLLVSVASGKSCPYCDDLDGRVVGQEEAFLDAGDFTPDGADRPLTKRHPSFHPPYHDGCDCMVVAG